MIADAEPVGGLSGTTYTYDIADRLTAITAPSPTASSAFTLDAAGRIATRVTATSPTPTTDTYSYLGSSETVALITTTGGTNATTQSLLGSDGSRVATKVAGSGTLSFLVPDLHGSVAACVAWNFTSITDAFRYDAYGRTVASVTSGSPTPWRYQGRMLVSASGAADLYDAGARFYSPGLGVFTQFDSVGGSAQNPISMNRYLYAAANPATLVDPSGHMYSREDMEDLASSAATTTFTTEMDNWWERSTSYHQVASTVHSDAVGDIEEYQFANHKVVSAGNADAAIGRKSEQKAITSVRNSNRCKSALDCVGGCVVGAGRRLVHDVAAGIPAAAACAAGSLILPGIASSNLSSPSKSCTSNISGMA